MLSFVSGQTDWGCMECVICKGWSAHEVMWVLSLKYGLEGSTNLMCL